MSVGVVVPSDGVRGRRSCGSRRAGSDHVFEFNDGIFRNDNGVGIRRRRVTDENDEINECTEKYCREKSRA